MREHVEETSRDVSYRRTHTHALTNRVPSAVVNNPIIADSSHLRWVKLTAIMQLFYTTHSHTKRCEISAHTHTHTFTNPSAHQCHTAASCVAVVVVVNGSWVWTQTSLSLLPQCFLIKTAITPHSSSTSISTSTLNSHTAISTAEWCFNYRLSGSSFSKGKKGVQIKWSFPFIYHLEATLDCIIFTCT